MIQYLPCVLRMVLLGLIMSGHVEDGNVWGIYFTDEGIRVGDFWAALIVIYLVYRIYFDIAVMLKEFYDAA